MDRMLKIFFSDVVVRRIVQDAEGAVHLFGNDEAHHLVREHQGRERPGLPGFFLYGLADAESPPDQDDQCLNALVHHALELLAPLYGIQLFAPLVEQYEVMMWLQFFEDHFFLQLFGAGHIGSQAFFRQLQQHQLNAVPGLCFAEIVLQALFYKRFIGFTDRPDLDVHKA